MLPSDLQSASFKGARFLVPHDETEEGRNAICHEYPDASSRYMEDNGRIPPRFSISALLHEPGLPGKLSRLRSALTSPGPGVLKHPWAGTQFVQVDGPYRIMREDRQSGVIELEIKFAVTGAPVLPGLVSGVAALVTGLAGSAVTALFTAFEKAYPGASGGVTATTLQSALSGIAGALDVKMGASSQAPGRLLSKAGEIVRDIRIATPLFVESYRAPFDDETLTDAHLVAGFKAALGEASAVSAMALAIIPTTADLSRRKSALALLGAVNEGAAFASLADAMAGRTYTTSDEVDADETLLAVAFETVQSRELDADLHDELARIYTAASEVLRDASVRLPRIATLAIRPLPASVLAYQLYDTDAREMALVDLNLGSDPVLMTGDVSVLAEA